MSDAITRQISSAQLNNGFSALTVNTRRLVREELIRAIRDTSMEYHRAPDRETQMKLAVEVEGIQVMLDSIATIDKEFEEICRSPNST